MTDVVGVHGVGWQFESRAKMIDLWRSHIAAGLHNERSPKHDVFTFEAAYYGHLYTAVTGRKGTSSDSKDLDKFETSFLLELAGDPLADPVDPADGRKAYLPGGVQWALRVVESTDYFAGLGHLAIRRFVKQVGRYFADVELHLGARAEVLNALKTGPSVVVAHSLGSVIAYDVLRDEPGIEVDTLVTVGSPLGLRAVRERLGTSADAEANRLPNVRRWVNVAATEDAVAMVKELKPFYGADVVDKQVHNSRMKAHLAVRYLAAVHTSQAIADAIA
ncbi:alpha/beta fold hydrolase [Saccharothrix stipae]